MKPQFRNGGVVAGALPPQSKSGSSRPLELVRRQTNCDTSSTGRVGRVTPCAPQPATGFPNGAHGVTRPTLLRNLIVTVLVSFELRVGAGFCREGRAN